ncbi:MAG: hypothetical protein GTO63_04745 [Anaerolineae bacterium]|nr:hypothetical protein [Anaerolineae bacterium]NIN94312.1 hypothetical protein [Anaerolineae bacterium]NIQ77375.1 hypothetical protein [Anaerolineae bacterium]
MTRRWVSTLLRLLALCGTLTLLLPQDVMAQDDPIIEIMEQMTPQERVGQLFMVDFAGDDTSEGSAIDQLIGEYKVGAVLLSESRRNINNQGEVPTALQVAGLTNELQNLAFRANSWEIDGQEFFVPLFIAVEQEGNGYPHSQLRNGFTHLPSQMAIGATWSEQHAQTAGTVTGQELAAVGVNMLLGPIIDILDTPRSGGRGDLGVRVFGGSPDWVARLGRAYIRGVHDGSGGRVVTVAHYFPGQGGSDRDPQSEVTTINKTLDEMRAQELMPFAGVTRYSGSDSLGTTDALLVGHTRCTAFQEDVGSLTDPLTLDENGLAAAMALPEFAAWRTSGLLVAGFLGADAIKDHVSARLLGFPHRRIAREALLAGNDLLPLVKFSLGEDWTASDFANMIDTIQDFQGLYESDEEFRDRVDESVRRILLAKTALYPTPSLDEVLVDVELAAQLVGAGGEAARLIAEDAVTLLHPSKEDLRSRLPATPTAEDDILIVDCFEDCYAIPVLPSGALQNTLLRIYGPQGTGQVSPDRVNTLSFSQVGDWMAGELGESDMAVVEGRIQEAEWVVFALSDYNPDDFPAARAIKDLLAERDYYLSDKKVVAITYDAPYHLDENEVGKLDAYFAVYSKVPASLEASLRPLFEADFIPAGVAPVNVEGVDHDVAILLAPDPTQLITLERLAPPQDVPLYVGGDPLVVRTGIIVDRNGNPVPDGTKVEFRGSYLRGDIFVEPQVMTDTIGGVAGASFWLSEPAPAGVIEISAVSGEASSAPMIVRLEVPVTPFPTYTPTSTATRTPTVTPTAVPPTPTVRPTPVPTFVPPIEPPVRPVDWFDFLLAGTGILVGSVVGLQARRGRRKGWEREVQLILYGVGLGLTGYILYGLGLLNPARILRWEGMAVRVFLLLFCAALAFLPSGVAWPRRS